MFNWKEYWSGKEELVTGACVGVAFVYFLHWWAVPSTILCSFLWRAGGTKGLDKLLRRLGVPFVLGVCLVLSHATTLLAASLAGVLAFGVLSLGYGVPDAETGDPGSHLGRFWLSLTGSLVVANVLTRATVGCLFGLCWFPLAVVGLVAWGGLVLFLTVVMPVVERGVR